jgi:dTDP-4-dehydrorhamnose 3,5-epimerase-like enzyme
MKHLVGGTGATFSKKNTIVNPLGNLRHIEKSELGKTLPFSEIYFSDIESKTVKAWKFHSRQEQNICVAFGEIRIICVKEMPDDTIFEVFELDSVALHGVLTIPARTYYAFVNMSEKATTLLNATDLPHDSAESLSLPGDFPKFEAILSEFGGSK